MTGFPLSLAKGIKKTPKFNTVVQKVAAGRGNASISLTPLPTWEFEVSMDSIQGNEATYTSVVSEFLGIFLACGGQNGLFLFTDPQDNTVPYISSRMFDVSYGSTTPMSLTGNDTSTQFQLARNIGGVSGALGGILVNGIAVAASLSSTGIVTFATAPASGSTLTWTGNFYYLCRFDADTVDATRTFTTNSGIDVWDFASIKFTSELV